MLSAKRYEAHRRDAPAVVPRAPRRRVFVVPHENAAVRVPRGDERRRRVQRADPRASRTDKRAERFPEVPDAVPVFGVRVPPSRAPRQRLPVPPARHDDAPARGRVHQLDALDRPRVTVKVVPRVLAAAPTRLERENVDLFCFYLRESRAAVEWARSALREQTRPEASAGRHLAPRAARRARERQRARRQKRERQLERVRGQIRRARRRRRRRL